jgi:5'(3')-deoxyribonucleotidase
MRILQIIQERDVQENSFPGEIYVDMDGVLADFFDSWAKLMKVDKWWNINKQHNIDDALQKIRDTDNFWLNIPLTPNAKNLLNLIKQVKGSYNICSSPLPGDPKSEPHKREWIKKHLAFFPPKNIYITHNKEQFAVQKDGTPNILIDDYGVNIRKWEDSGGIGFKHKDHKFERTAQRFMQGESLELISEKWSAKYKRSINCNNPKGFSQKAHCAGRKKKVKENYTREELPQIKNKHLENIEHEIVFLNIDEVKPVQKERVMENFRQQVDRLLEGEYAPIVVDCDNRIVNGHHRYDAVRLLGETTIPVARIPHTLECIIENFADGKKKGKSRPGRVKRAGASCKGSVTDLRAKAKKYSGEKAKMYHWCANMKSGRNK